MNGLEALLRLHALCLEAGSPGPSPWVSPGCKGWLLAHSNSIHAAGDHSQLLQSAGLGGSLQTCVIFLQPSRELPFTGLWIAGGIVPGQTLQGLQSISISAGQRGITFPLPYFIFSLSFQPGSPLQKVQARQNSPSPLIRVRACVCVCNHFSPLSEDKAGL